MIEVKNADKIILRMSLGRKNREYKNNTLSRGYPKNVNNWY